MPFEEGVDVLIAKQMPKDILWQEMQGEKKNNKNNNNKNRTTKPTTNHSSMYFMQAICMDLFSHSSCMSTTPTSPFPLYLY